MDTAQWIDGKLIHVEWRGEPEPKPQTTTYSLAAPSGNLFCYWCAVVGDVYAVASDSNSSCIAAVNNALMLACKVPSYRHIYVIWQPRNHTQKAWDNWSKKWSKRTKEGTA